jgi:RNA polymerase sigma-70 factor (ECF subfamily)
MGEWIRCAQGGDTNAFGRVAERYESRLRHFLEPRVGKRLRSRVGVEDMVQETFLRALGLIDRFEWRSEEAFWAWLCSLSRIVLEREVRRQNAKKRDRAREVPVEEEDLQIDGVSPSRILRRNDRFERLKRALAVLPPDYRRAVFLAQIRRLPTGEIARRLGRSPNATSMLLLRAYTKLRAALGETESLGLEDDHRLDGLEDLEDEMDQKGQEETEGRHDG